MNQILLPLRGHRCVCAQPCIITRHHRHPTSIGGVDKQINIAILPLCSHQRWHQLFKNWCAPQIAWYISQGRLLKHDVVCMPKYVGVRGKYVTRAFAKSANYLPHPIAKPYISVAAWFSWLDVFNDFSSDEDVIEEINAHFIDPYYRLYIVAQ